jgi:hypothetical protein
MTGKHATVSSRPVVVVAAMLLSLAAVAFAVATRFSGSAQACSPKDPNCVVVSATDPGGPGGGGSSDPGGGGGGTSKPDPCAKYPGLYYAMCKQNKGNGCLNLYDSYFGTMPIDQLNTFLAANGCPAVPAGAAPPPTPAELAQQAADSIELPDPGTGRYPAGTLRDGRPYTVVGAYTWYWTDASTWRSFTATARAGGNFATVTAAPVTLSFTPGDGNGAVSCPGPGSVWRQGVNGPWDPSPSGCQYRYPHSSIDQPNQQVTATYTLTWQLTWTGSGNTAGTLTTKTTAARSTFAVAEVESVVTR